MSPLSSTMLIVAFYLLFSTSVSGDPHCDKQGHLIYKDLGCRPNTIKGETCADSYDCDFKHKNNTCLFRNKLYDVNQPVKNELLAGSCEQGCFCGNEGRFFCAIIECAEYWGMPPLEEGCYRTYSLDKCCSTGINCPSEGTKVDTCEVDGKTYREGERFFPKDACYRCICGKYFNGKYEEPYCERINCANQMKFALEYQRKCAPVYRRSDSGVLCCPSSWICPQPTDKIITVDPDLYKTSNLSCKYGEETVKVGEGFIRKGDGYTVQCECSLPPLLTCTNI